MKQYKVLTQKDKWFSNKFDPAMLEEALIFMQEMGGKLFPVLLAIFREH